jgi:hypothetical protein
MEMPSLSEFLLTAADLLNLHLSARLVVISSSHTRDHHGWATSDGIVTLTRALLVAGAQCILVCLWPVPDTATKILLRAFYSALLQVWDQFLVCLSHVDIMCYQYFFVFIITVYTNSEVKKFSVSQTNALYGT